MQLWPNCADEICLFALWISVFKLNDYIVSIQIGNVWLFGKWGLFELLPWPDNQLMQMCHAFVRMDMVGQKGHKMGGAGGAHNTHKWCS